MSKENITENIGSISNYYGGLAVKEVDGKYFWSIENHDGYKWERITKTLYILLRRHESEYQRNLIRIAKALKKK